MSAPQPVTPTERLFNILVTFLCPLFLGGPTGNTDIAVARATAIEMLESFRIRTPWDLLTAVQVVGFAVAALGSLGLSMEDDLPLAKVLRCRSNANALQRTSDRAQARLDKRQEETPDQGAADQAQPDEAAIEDAMRRAAAAQQCVAEARARLEGWEPLASPVLQALGVAAAGPAAVDPARPPVASTLASTAEPAARTAPASAATAQDLPDTARTARKEREHQMVWANAMATVATEFAQEMTHLPPSEQRLHKLRVAALSEVAEQLSKGAPPASLPLPGLALTTTQRQASPQGAAGAARDEPHAGHHPGPRSAARST